MFEVVLGILPPISTNYLFVFDKSMTGLVHAALGGRGGKKRRKGEATVSATTALDAATAAARRFSHHKENKKTQVKASLGRLCSLFTPGWIWQELKTRQALQLIMGWLCTSGRPAAVTNWLN